jgi:hypothetical protein
MFIALVYQFCIIRNDDENKVILMYEYKHHAMKAYSNVEVKLHIF